MEEKLTQLKQHLARIEDIEGAWRLMVWDMQTYMPSGATQTRADQIATIRGLAHEMRTDEELGRLLMELNNHLDELDFDSDDASMIRVNWREFQWFAKIPTDLWVTFSEASTLAHEAWKEAREKDTFQIFRPHLEKLLDLQLELAEFLKNGAENPYDPLIQYYEAGMTSSEIDALFTAIKPQLIDLTRSTREVEQVDESPILGAFPEDDLLEMSRLMAEKLGYDFERGRLDLTVHPFTMGNSFRDVRITTRFQDDYPIFTILASIHEAGHAIHRQQCSPEFYRTLLSRYTMGVGESQSRAYEMIIGRSREFWAHFYPQMQDRFPWLENVGVEDFYRAINKVEPGLIRVMADPVTYGLHIMLRFELENEMINGKVKVADLPELWNTKMEEYLGVVPPSDIQGVLQDVHWTDRMGYFPSYLLGSIFAVQLWYKLLEELPETPEDMAAGEYMRITEWLGRRVHTHGGKYTLPEMAERALGESLTSEPFIDYLEKKYGEIYGLV
ncbi:MAG: carboxypeptidase M32 [Anaerolineaceae bacterium]|nr:MAG: carboxypeptidase M32 [Anaerolineaceae bacterium]